MPDTDVPTRSKKHERLLANRDEQFKIYEPAAVAYRDADTPKETASADERSTFDGLKAAYEAEKRKLDEIDAEIAAVVEDEKRAAEIDKTRQALQPALRSVGGPGSPAVVRSEPGVYGEGSPYSYFADLVYSAWPADPHWQAASQRLAEYGRQVVRDAVNDPKERSRAAGMARQHYRDAPEQARSFVGDLERRAMDTTSGSGGSFVTPQYLVSDYAPYRQFGRAFVDQSNKQDLPDYGMTVYLPAVQGAAGVSTQTQGSGVAETDPTAGYLSANLVTAAGEITISQQLLDRAGPGIQFDKIAFDQLNRAYAVNIDTGVLTVALTSPGTVADTATGATGANVIQDFYSDIAQSYGQMAGTAGTVFAPTHVFMTALEWAFLSSQTDSNGRPLIVPGYAMPFNAIGVGPQGGVQVPDGDTGYKVLGCEVFVDSNIPTVAGTPTQTQLIAADPQETWVWEGPQVPRVIPQTYAQNLQVLLQIYAYYAVIIRYPKTIQQIGGARYPAVPTFTRS